MRTALRIVAVVIVSGAFIWWFQAGKNTGWTKDRVAVEKIDEITEITYTEYEERFVPGIDFLAAGLLGGLVIGGLTFVRRRTRAA